MSQLRYNGRLFSSKFTTTRIVTTYTNYTKYILATMNKIHDYGAPIAYMGKNTSPTYILSGIS